MIAFEYLKGGASGIACSSCSEMYDNGSLFILIIRSRTEKEEITFCDHCIEQLESEIARMKELINENRNA